MDVKIHNAKEAVKACGTELRWVTDSVAQMITDFDASFDVPPDHVVERIIEETVWKLEEVPCGWCIFWGHPEWVKNMRATGKPGDLPMICETIGAGFFIVNRWTGKVETIRKYGFPTWKAAVQNYIYHLPENTQESCQQSEFRNRWEPDPIRFWPPRLDFVTTNQMTDLDDVRFALQVDDVGKQLLVENEPHLNGLPPLYGGPPFILSCSIIDVKQEGIMTSYTIKPEFDMNRLRSHSSFGVMVEVSVHEAEVFPDGVWTYFHARVGN